MPTIQKWGNSLAVRIPATLASQLGVEPGTPVEIAVQNGSLVVTPRKRPKYSLREMLKRCKPQDFHGEIDWGPDVGREVID
jgi:antitoxin MazE